MPEARPPLRDPAVLVATAGGIGYLPKAPGTWGSLAALPAGWLIVEAGGVPALLAAVAAGFAAGVWACGRYERLTGTRDAGACVADEVVGQWIVLLVLPLDPWLYAAGFAVFRVLDIAKPWPVGRIDRNVAGGLGVMLDDAAAGVLGAALLWLAQAALAPG